MLAGCSFFFKEVEISMELYHFQKKGLKHPLVQNSKEQKSQLFPTNKNLNLSQGNHCMGHIGRAFSSAFCAFFLTLSRSRWQQLEVMPFPGQSLWEQLSEVRFCRTVDARGLRARTGRDTGMRKLKLGHTGPCRPMSSARRWQLLPLCGALEMLLLGSSKEKGGNILERAENGQKARMGCEGVMQ